MSDWKDYRFSELLVDETISYGVVQPGSYTEDGVPIVRVNNIKDGNILTGDVFRIEPAIEKRYLRTRLKGGELLITVVGSVGECAIVPDNLTGWNVARAVSVARVKPQFNTVFIKYCFKLSDVKHQLYGNTNDTVQPTLNLSSLKDLTLTLPEPKLQHEIVEILSSLDDKIDLLHRQNKTLESLAETLFRQWFVEEAEEWWEQTTLGDIGKVVTGKTPLTAKKEFWGAEIPFITPSDFSNYFKYANAAERALSEEGRKAVKNCSLREGAIMVTCIGSDMGKIAIAGKPCVTNQQINSLVLHSDFSFPEYVYQYLRYIYPVLRNMAMGGTTMPIINKTDFEGIEILKPPKSLLQKFEQTIEPFSTKITHNLTQIHTLTQLRDTLLPKLMSGEVRVC